MSDWLTGREAAEALGCSLRHFLRMAREGNYNKRTVEKDGRRLVEYDPASLPPAAQRAWAAKQKTVPFIPSVTSSSRAQLALSLTIPTGPNMRAEDRAQAEKRYGIIEPLIDPEKHQALWLQAGSRKGRLVELLAQQHGTKSRTIHNWIKSFREAGLVGLVRQVHADQGRPRIFNQAALDFLLAAALPRPGVYGKYSVAEIHRAYGEERTWRASHADQVLGEFEALKYYKYLAPGGKLSPAAQLPAASERIFRRWFEKIPEIVKMMAREGEEAFHNSQEILSWRSLEDLKPLQYVVMDHRVLDIFALARDPKGGWRLIRPWLTAAIDFRTRKWLAWLICETPSSDSIATVLKRVCLDHGVPEAVYWDNGRDFRSEWLEGRRLRASDPRRLGEMRPEVRGVLTTLGIRVHHAIVKRSRSKIIEPCFISVANFDRLFPFYCGNKPSERPEAFEKLLARHERWLKGEAPDTPFPTIEAIAWYYDEALTTLNERPHSGVGMEQISPDGRDRDMSPNQAWNKLIGSVTVRKASPEEIQWCFCKRRRETVRNGEVHVHFGGRAHHYRMLGNSVALAALNGREVQIAYDPLDLGTAALYHEDRFVGLIEAVELRRMGESAFVADEKDRRAMRREVKAFIAGVHHSVHVPSPLERAQRRMAVRAVAPGAVAALAYAPATLPEGITEAAAASVADRAFTFAGAAPSGVDLIRSADHAAYQDDTDSAFHFFSDEEGRT